ncbi:MAG: GlgC family sugar phosphate nucleotidyltransferase, partial [Thermodesulfobacteriota bacterium]
PKVTVHSFAEVEDSILLEGVDVGRNAKIRRTIIDKEVQIPEGMEIGYYLDEDAKRFTVTASGIVVVPKGIRL